MNAVDATEDPCGFCGRSLSSDCGMVEHSDCRTHWRAAGAALAAQHPVLARWITAPKISIEGKGRGR